MFRRYSENCRLAHRIELRMDGSLRMSRYWEPVFEPEERPFEDVVEQFRETLKQSVHMHLQSECERGSFLSSGIDSTAICHHHALASSRSRRFLSASTAA